MLIINSCKLRLAATMRLLLHVNIKFDLRRKKQLVRYHNSQCIPFGEENEQELFRFTNNITCNLQQ